MNLIRIATREDIPEINAILNHPSVHKWANLFGDGPLDVSERFDQLMVIMAPGGLFMLDHVGAGNWIAHVAFLPKAQVEIPLMAGRQAMDACFREMPVLSITAWVDKRNKAATRFARMLGFATILDAEDGTLFQMHSMRWACFRSGLRKAQDALGRGLAEGHPQAPYIAALGCRLAGWEKYPILEQ